MKRGFSLILLGSIFLTVVSAASGQVTINSDKISVNGNPLAEALNGGDTMIGYSSSVFQFSTITDASNDTVAKVNDQYDSFKVEGAFRLPVGAPPWE